MAVQNGGIGSSARPEHGVRLDRLSLIVHPSFFHTLKHPPESKSAIEPSWTRLPRECLLIISSHLSAEDLCRLAMCSKELRQLCSDDQIWQRLCELKFNVPRRKTPPSSWYELYKFNKMVFKRLYNMNNDNQNHANSLLWPVLPTAPDGMLLIRSRAN